MQSSFIMTVNAKDMPGAKASFLGAIRELGAEVAVERSMRLGGRFSVIMKFMLAGKSAMEIQGMMKERFPTMIIRCSQVEKNMAEMPLSKIIRFVVKCSNRTDPEGELQSVLADLDCYTKDVVYNRYPVTGIGETVFTARCTVGIPSHCSSGAVADEIERMMEGARVSVV